MARHRARNTEKRIAKLRKEGAGQGVGADYKPYITVTTFASEGRSQRIKGQTTGRVNHLLSNVEGDVFRRFDGATNIVDIREQFPLPREATTAIADKLGVIHPSADGVDVVMTTDLLITFEGGRRLALAIKPAEKLDRPHVVEKLWIERTYWMSLGVEWAIVTDREVTREQRIGDQEVAEWAHVDGLVSAQAEVLDDRADEMLVEIASLPFGCRLNDFCRRVEVQRGWVRGEGLSSIKRLMARKLVALRGRSRLDAFGPADQLVIA